MPQPADIRPLTALRFFAALWVVLYTYWPNLSGAVVPALVGKGYLGVDMFFTLSGFILCHVYLDAFAAGGFSYGRFLWARLSRIYPLHLVTLAAIGAMALAAQRLGRPVDPNVLSWASLPANLTLTQAWGLAPVAGWNHPSWSISAEWFAYLLFPVFAVVVLRLRGRPWTTAALALGLLWTLSAVFPLFSGYSLTEATIRWGALRIVPGFALGCAINQLWRAGVVKGRTLAWIGAAFSGAAAMASALANAPDALTASIFGLLILCLAAAGRQGQRGRAFGVFVYLGEISYSIYMVCVPWKLLFVNVTAVAFHYDKARMPLGLWIVFVAGVIPLAALSYHLVEKPARAALRGVRVPSPFGRASVA